MTHGPAGRGWGLAALVPVLERARQVGFLGPGPVGAHIRHALGFAAVVGPAPARLLDLGSGGGVPGLVLALYWPAAEVVLLDANQRRAGALEGAVSGLGLAGRVEVVRSRAETAGRDGRWRERFDVVVARGFGAPAVTAECASPLVSVGGLLVVSEPPTVGGASELATIGGDEPGSRWPTSPLGALGLVPRPPERLEHSFQVLDKTGPCPARFPRRVGMPGKRPLFAGRGDLSARS